MRLVKMPERHGRRWPPPRHAPPETARQDPTLSSVPATTAAPRVIPRDQHPISRRSISPNALRVLYRLRDAGHAAYLVGGAVRDLLLGIQPRISTSPPTPPRSRSGTCSATAA